MFYSITVFLCVVLAALGIIAAVEGREAEDWATRISFFVISLACFFIILIVSVRIL